jgi:hypothetical protein
MAVTLETLTVTALRAQPLSFEETDTLNGLVARRWVVEGLLRPAEWLELLQIFEAWQSNRRQDPDALVSLSVGSTVLFSGSAAGYSWSNVACWFASAPAGEAIGAYIGASFELLDAEQMLAVWIREQESQRESAEDAQPNYGTLTLGAATLTLTDQPDGYAEGPQLRRAASGEVVINGPLGVVRAKRITGYTDGPGWAAVQTWYEATANAMPVRGTYYPASPPEMRQEIVLENGVKTTRYVISLELWEV